MSGSNPTPKQAPPHQWKGSTSFGRDDLPLVAKIAEVVVVRIYENQDGTEK